MCLDTLLLSYMGSVRPQGHRLKAVVGDPRKEIIKPDSVKWQSGVLVCVNRVVDVFFDYSSDCFFSKALAIRSKSSISGSFINCCTNLSMLSLPERWFINRSKVPETPSTAVATSSV